MRLITLLTCGFLDYENCIDPFLEDIEHDEIEMLQEVAKQMLDDQQFNTECKQVKLVKQVKMGQQEGKNRNTFHQ